MIRWSYGVTCVPPRFHTTLPGTVASLAKAGFPKPRMFCDGPWEGELPEYLRGLEFTVRAPRLGAYGNWWLALQELYIRQCRADYFALFQDDCKCVPCLREFLEQAPSPADGYLNLYTSPFNTKPLQGWYLANQKGLGAVALVFSNEMCQEILRQDHMIDHIGAGRGTVCIDGAVATAANRVKRFEYVRNPSLVQHVGYPSTLRGDKDHPPSPVYAGDDATLDDLLKQQPQRRRNAPPISAETPAPVPVAYAPRGPRVGLVGYNTNSGLGVLHRAIADWVEVDRWLVMPHRSYPNLPPHPEVDTVICNGGDTEKIKDFFRSVDVVIFGEQPVYADMLQLCRLNKVKTICIPMQEWMPPAAGGWAREVDLFLCPTQQAYDLFAHQVPCLYLPWPIDTIRFPFQQRGECRRFVYAHGHGGWKGRKGGDAVRVALRHWPDMPLVVASQTRDSWPKGAEVLGELPDAADIYRQGDVLIVPHCVDGLCLSTLEAAASGMPVVSTNGRPWNEHPAVARLRSTVSRRAVRRPVDWHECDPGHIVEVCRGLLGRNLAEESRQARAWAEGRSWATAGPVMTRLLRGEITGQAELDAALQSSFVAQPVP